MRSPASKGPDGLRPRPRRRSAISSRMIRWPTSSWVSPRSPRKLSSKKCPKGPWPMSCSSPAILSSSSMRVLDAAVLGGREHPARRLQLRHPPEPLHPGRVDEVLLGGLAGHPVGARVQDVVVDGIGDEAAPLVRVDALHDSSLPYLHEPYLRGYCFS